MIFLAGIHGVGKSTLLAEVNKENNVTCYSASNLIAKLKSEDYIKTKKRKDIKSDQDILLTAIEEFVEEEDYILDGHFCLWNEQGQIKRIPKSVFSNLKIDIIFVLTANTNDVINRLFLRDGTQYSLEQISLFQKEEIAYAKEISFDLQIECKIINSAEKIVNYVRGNLK